MDTVIGQTVAHYRVGRRLGEGGMGVLYAAEDLRLGRQVALKFLREGTTGDDPALHRFRREARAASALNNPHICTVHDVGLHEGRPFIVMELLEGTTLGDRLRVGPLPVGEMFDLARQLVDALAAAHAKGIVHRDLKPANVFLTDSGLLKVLDFGVAKLQRDVTGLTTSVRGLEAALLDGGADVEGTGPGLVLGTLPYMSPEQARGQEIDGRSDLFSCGAVIYEMATGRRAFVGGSTNDIVDAILNHSPLPPSRVRPDLPPGLDGLVLRALEKHRDARFQSVTEMQEALRSVRARSHPGEVRDERPDRSQEDAPSGESAPAASLRPTPSAKTGVAIGPIRSLAVLPLQALSGDAEQELLADGITDALIAHLSGIGAVRVISRTSVLRYKGRTKTIPQIAAELGVEGVVEGSILLSGDRVRVTARLIDAARDHGVWARTYERDLKDVLALQNDLARAVTREIRVALTPDEERRLAGSRPIDPEAHFAFLRGQFHLKKGRPADLEKALREFHIATERDPTFGPAWSGIGWAHTWLAGATYALVPPRDAMPLAKAAAERALESGPSAEAHAILGLVAQRYEYDFGRAEQEFERALDLGPGVAVTHEALSLHLSNLGRFDEAIREQTTALALDPIRLGARTNLAWRHYFARRFDDAVAISRQTLALEPGFVDPRLALGFSLLESGDGSRALAEFERLRSRTPTSPVALAAVGYAQARLGETERARSSLRELLDTRRQRYVPADWVALVCVGLGRWAAALAWLETAFEERSPGLCEMAVSPLADGLRSLPRFQDLARRVGLPSADLRPPAARVAGSANGPMPAG